MPVGLGAIDHLVSQVAHQDLAHAHAPCINANVDDLASRRVEQA
jgi:hypothetical protein